MELLKRKNTLIVSAFTGTGKTKFYNDWMKGLHPEYDLVLDSDSYKFKWILGINGNRLINREFPNNYLEHIKMNIGEADIIFVSTHKEVINLLKQNNINFILIYPTNSVQIKQEYLQRYKNRNSDDDYIELIDKSWDLFMKDLNEIDNKKIILKEKEYISNLDLFNL